MKNSWTEYVDIINVGDNGGRGKYGGWCYILFIVYPSCWVSLPSLAQPQPQPSCQSLFCILYAYARRHIRTHTQTHTHGQHTQIGFCVLWALTDLTSCVCVESVCDINTLWNISDTACHSTHILKNCHKQFSSHSCECVLHIFWTRQVIYVCITYLGLQLLVVIFYIFSIYIYRSGFVICGDCICFRF